MKTMTVKSMSAFTLALVTGGVLATTPVDAETSTATVTLTPGDVACTVPKFDFGSHVISLKEETYNAESATQLTVTDLRGTSDGWKVTLAQSGNFKTASGAELKGTTLRLSVGTITNSDNGNPEIPSVALVQPGSGAVEVLKAVKGKGNAVSERKWAADHARLIVPANTPQKNAKYTATLVWTLAKTPN